MSPKIKLTYFDSAGRAEPIRIAFSIGGVAFEDERLTGEQFGAKKAAGAFKNGQLPVLEVNGEQIAQSNAILVYAGKLSGLYPTDPLAGLKVDEILATMEDFTAALVPAFHEKDEAKKVEVFTALFGETIPTWLNRISKLLGSNYAVGDSLTVADLKVVALLEWFNAGKIPGQPSGFMTAFPALTALGAKVAAHPGVVAYYAKAKPSAYPKLKLTYFDMGGRAEPIRLAFAYAGIPFEDERLSFPEFGAKKAAGAFKNGSVPVLEVNGEQIAQSNAILNYAGKLSGLYPWDPVASLKSDEVLSTCEDIASVLTPSFTEKDEAKKLAMRADLIKEDGALTVWFKRLNALVSRAGTGWTVGNSLTVADLKVVVFVQWFQSGRLDGIPTDWVNQFAALPALVEKVLAVPAIAAYYAAKNKK